MNIYEKLANVQKNLKANKSQYNEFGKYNYRSCEDILEAVKPLLSDNGLTLTLTDDISLVGNRFYVMAKAVLTSAFDGQTISVSAFAREDEFKKGMDACQVTGTASSYARKYALNGLFCIDDAKDSDATNTSKKDEKPDGVVTNVSCASAPPSSTTVAFTCAKCGKPLTVYTDANGKPVSLRAHAERSQKKFGRVLCLDCINDESQHS